MFVLVAISVLLVSNSNGNSIGKRALNQSNECLKAHNKLRAKHEKTPRLVLDKVLTKSAQAYAEYLASNDLFEHSDGKYGENLYMTMGGEPQNVCDDASNSWYSEIENYDYDKPDYAQETGHFTQLVWRGSRKVGFGIATKGENTVVVAQYLPGGNKIGDFEKNVMPLI
ncbi:Golgi-associated plant pathogenesis-related protein 1 [Hydra vulgaris]|uniref:Golgi-associated plant pathogenesis-related protein 1 n=1 Tax=Hydra vulgaris TaxID=6087 RepID=UPI001F5F3AE3|nr:Golgi-associated plant pathogenesis-related protein 1-like [Hydra vulgaris]